MQKRHVVMDEVGLLMSVAVTEENLYDSIPTEGVIKKMKRGYPRLIKILGGRAYHGVRLVNLAQVQLKAD